MKHVSRAAYWFGLLSVIYVVLQLVLPPVAATLEEFHLSHSQYKVLAIVVSIPAIIAWFAAFYGYAKFEKYAESIKKSSDGQAFRRIAVGLKYLAWGLPVTSIITALLGGIAHEFRGFLGAGFIISHYVSLALSLIAFSIMNSGTRRLADSANQSITLRATRWLVFGFISIGVWYTYGTIHSVETHNTTAYHLPLWLILFTIVMPYLYAWVMGLLSAYEISLYRKHVSGILYQRSLNYVASGIGTTVLASVVLQYLTSGSPYLRRITFNWTTCTVYGLLLLYAVGFILLAVGATKLNKIEEV